EQRHLDVGMSGQTVGRSTGRLPLGGHDHLHRGGSTGFQPPRSTVAGSARRFRRNVITAPTTVARTRRFLRRLIAASLGPGSGAAPRVPHKGPRWRAMAYASVRLRAPSLTIADD